MRSEPVVAVGSLTEAIGAVQNRYGPERIEDVHELLAGSGMRIVPMAMTQALLAREGMVRFGKGRGADPAVLNFGDLFAYASARRLSASLLFKVDGFAATEIVPAIAG